MENILLPSLVSMGVIGLVLALGLVFASKKFSVEVDPRVEQINEALPGANCGACGMAGCAAYAEAAARGDVPPNLCTVGGAEAAEKIAEILGVEVSTDFQKQIAHVFCGGRKGLAVEVAEYQGIKDCRAAHALGGSKLCMYGCLGFGTCVDACPFDAMEMSEDGLPVVDKELCTGCGICVEACPRHIISLVPESARVFVDCSSKDKGAVVRKACKVGCIGCMRCVKACEFDAISVKDFLAVIDQEKCTACGKCAEVCPANCIIIEKSDLCNQVDNCVS